MSIKKYDEDNSKCFLIDTKNTKNNQLMKYGLNVNYNIKLNNYKVGNDEIIYFIKK